MGRAQRPAGLASAGWTLTPRWPQACVFHTRYVKVTETLPVTRALSRPRPRPPEPAGDGRCHPLAPWPLGRLPRQACRPHPSVGRSRGPVTPFCLHQAARPPTRPPVAQSLRRAGSGGWRCCACVSPQIRALACVLNQQGPRPQHNQTKRDSPCVPW